MASEPDWEHVLASAARLQELVPDTVLVGGTAAATHARHRASFDHDHVLTDLRERFDAVLEGLEATDGWVTVRIRRPVLVPGNLDGVETGIRQLIRRRPLEVEVHPVGDRTIRVPTLAETARVKAWLVLRRNASRDYLDVVALADRLGDEAPVVALTLDEYYQDQIGPGGMRVATQLAKQLAEPTPYDLDDVDLRHYRKLDARWREWEAVVAACRRLADRMLDLLAGTAQ